MISQKYHAIFIHIPKTAGSSIEQKLGLYELLTPNAQDHRTVRDVRPISLWTHGRYLGAAIDGFSRRALLQEMTGLSAQPRRATEHEFASYLKFTVVRNPWARIYSWYRNVSFHPKTDVPSCDLATFLARHAGNWALRPQRHWMIDLDGSLPLDRVIRFERLAEEMPELLKDLGFRDCELPHICQGQGGDYRAAYTDHLAEWVGRRYHEEIDQFGYTFDQLEAVTAACA